MSLQLCLYKCAFAMCLYKCVQRLRKWSHRSCRSCWACPPTHTLHVLHDHPQGLLRACSYDRRLVTSLVPIVLGASYLNDSAKGGRVLEGVSSDTFDTLVRDTTGSHVVEAVAEVGAWAGGDSGLGEVWEKAGGRRNVRGQVWRKEGKDWQGAGGRVFGWFCALMRDRTGYHLVQAVAKLGVWAAAGGQGDGERTGEV
eukprot:358552-Chlamydomonas_euryale.AAC.3